MDNDLMARRLRPPSEPFRASPVQPEEADSRPPADATQSVSTSQAGSPTTTAPAQMEGWDPLGRDDIPWDRPTDYVEQTDSATAEQPAWDRPSNVDLFDSEPVEDQTPADDSMNEMSEPYAETAPAFEPLSAWPQIEPVSTVAATPVIAEMEPEPVSADPDDAYAPVLGDVSVPMGRAWPEMNGHDAGRNDSTVAADREDASQVAAPTPSEPAPMAHSDSFIEPTSESTARADTAPPNEAPGQTSWFSAAVEPTTLIPGMGPTPPPELFADAADFASPAAEWGAADWEAVAEEPEWDVPAAIQDAYDFHPELELVAAAEVASDPEPEPVAAAEVVADVEPEAAWEPVAAAEPMPVAQTASPYSTAPAPATPLVVRIKVSIVDESKGLVNPGESARVVRTADFTIPTTADAESALGTGADLDDEFTPRHPALDHRSPISPTGGAESAWIGPSVAAQSVEESVWLDPAHDQPLPWILPTPPVQVFASPTAVPWADSAAPAPAVPQTSEFAPPRTAEPHTTDAPATVEQPARWVQPTYGEAPVTLQPAAQAASPFAPAPVAGSYAQQTSAEPRAVAAPQVATVSADGQRDSWFLSIEPADVDAAEARDEVVDGKEPSALVTGVLTIGMAVLVIVLVLVFIQLMTSLLR